MSATHSAPGRAIDDRCKVHGARRLSCIAVCASLSGCATAPALPLFGAAFPAWLFCIVAGTAASVAVHLLAGKFGWRKWLAPSAVSYPALAALVAMLTWLIFFPA
jgi:hypothetical protein